MKRLCKMLVLMEIALILISLASCGGGGGKVIGEIDKAEIVYLHALQDDSPVAVILEEKQGTMSTIKEYYLMYGKEKMGPFDELDISDIQYSKNNSSFLFSATIDNQKKAIFVRMENQFFKKLTLP